ncbi:MAG: hypothetical protein MI755_19895 [Sphingomonadales bacterium]|nr:hypothetical protein [Sphingomonadales bacterium]
MTALRQSLGLFGILVLFGCAPAAEEQEAGIMTVGLKARVESGGNVFDVEVTAVDGPAVTMETRWNGRTISERTLYRGIYALTGSESGSAYVNQLDPAEIDKLFPLKVGNETSFHSRYRVASRPGAGQAYIYASVRDKTVIEIRSGSYDVFVIDVVTDLAFEGQTSQFTKTVWYAPALGLNLKTKISDGEKTFYSRVLSIELPRQTPMRENTVGTVMI